MKAIKTTRPNLSVDPDAVLVLNEDAFDDDAVVAFALDTLGQRRDSYFGITVRHFEDDRHVLVRFHKE